MLNDKVHKTNLLSQPVFTRLRAELTSIVTVHDADGVLISQSVARDYPRTMSFQHRVFPLPFPAP